MPTINAIARPRDRVIQALKKERLPGIPWHIDLTSAFTARLKQETGCEDPDAYLGNHLYRVKYKRNATLGNGFERDLFGVTWTHGASGGDVGVVAEYPLRTAPLGQYRFPEVQVDFAHRLCDQLATQNRERFTLFSITMCFFERAWSLRGMEELLVGMAGDEPEVAELFARIEAHHMALLDAVLERDFDGIYFGDDWGQQHGLIMGPRLWRKYLKPAFARMFQKIKSKGKYICLHSCGDLREIFPDLVEMGLDIYNTLQPEIYDLTAMKREYGKIGRAHV
jgi:uroporphyrinogen decarboxylase